jgi:hypothetical protein
MLKSITKAVLQNPIVLAAPLETRLESRPVTVQLISPGSFSLDNVQKVALGALVVPAVLGWLYSLFSAEWTLFFICGFMLLLVGLIFGILRLRAAMSWQATWHQDFVEVEDGRFGRPVQWREPLSAFSGLKRDFGLLPSFRQYSSGRRVHGLLLVHPDPQKSVLLHASYKPIGDDIAGYYAGQLGKQPLV